MSKLSVPRISVVVPVYNESTGLATFHATLLKTMQRIAEADYEIIYVDDGSTDTTATLVRKLSENNQRIRLLKLSRNFGKESALSAGIAAAAGQAIITIDGDNQHPVDVIPDLIKAWQAGAQVVVGVRNHSVDAKRFDRISSWGFYQLFNRLTSQKLVPGSTDFRLIDRFVQQVFANLPETLCT